MVARWREGYDVACVREAREGETRYTRHDELDRLPPIGVPYRREPRSAGRTKYPTRKMLRFTADAITSFSSAPLRIVGAIGFALVGFCAISLVYTLYKHFLTDDTVEGWTSVIVLLL
jgi:hypothetical protein